MKMDWNALQSRLGGEVVVAGAPGYEVARRPAWLTSRTRGDDPILTRRLFARNVSFGRKIYELQNKVKETNRMANKEPLVEQSITTNGVTAITPWAEASEQLEGKYWLATVKPNGQPHVMPLFGIWSEGALYFTSGMSVQKARNLAQNAHCVITATGKNLDRVMEGKATKVRDETKLQRVAEL
jgi:hypothetical protein